MDLILHVWRQPSPDAPGAFETYTARGVTGDMSFLEMLDVVNERLIEKGEEPIHFEHDCREGICGSCGMMINGVAHGSRGNGLATCQRIAAAASVATRSLVILGTRLGGKPCAVELRRHIRQARDHAQPCQKVAG